VTFFSRFLQFGKGQAWNISRIEGTFTQAMDLLKPDEACLSHTALARLIELGTLSIDEVEWSAVINILAQSYFFLACCMEVIKVI